MLLICIILCSTFLLINRDVYGEESLNVYNKEDAVEYLKEMLLARKENIEFYIDIEEYYTELEATVYDDWNHIIGTRTDTLYWEATKYYEDGLSYEGDALANNVIEYSCIASEEGDKVKCSYSVTYATTLEQEQELQNAISLLIDEMQLEGKSEFQKAKLIYEYVCKNVKWDIEHVYDEEYTLMYTAYAALINKTALYRGYAELYYRLCKEAGLSVRCIIGETFDYEHVWNIVRVGDKYYNVETREGSVIYHNNSGDMYKYFLITDRSLYYRSRYFPYRSKEFYSTYPMAADPWFDYSKLEEEKIDNIFETSYNNTEGGKVTNQANGKGKIIIFGKITCGYTQGTISNLSKEDFADVDIIFVDNINSSLEEVENFIDEYGSDSDSIIYTYESPYEGADMCVYASLIGDPSNITYPHIVYINPDNKVVYQENRGVFTAQEIRRRINEYIEYNELIELSDDSVSIKKGEGAYLEVFVRGLKRNSQFFAWESSNDAIVSVDEYGLITAKAEGNARITCRANDKVYATCTVTVNGAIDGLKKFADGKWHFYKNGVVDITYTGMAKNEYGWWYVRNGELDRTYTGIAQNEYGTWYMKNGGLDRTYSGMYQHGNILVCIDKGKYDPSYTGILKGEDGCWYVKNGTLERTYTGMYVYNGKWLYATESKFDNTYTGMAKNEYGWWYIKDGRLDRSYTGMAKNAYGWWYIKDGKLDTTYTGVAENEYGYWYMENGKIAGNYTGLYLFFGKYDLIYMYIDKGCFNPNYTGMAQNEHGFWFYVQNGIYSFLRTDNYTGMAKNEESWWYIKNGELDQTYTGMAKNQYGWWYMKNGKLDLTYTGMAKNAYGWWYMKNGKLDQTYTGMAKNQYGWYYMKNGKLDTTYTGLATNAYGTWYMKNGSLQRAFSSKVTINGKIYQIKAGKVI